MTKQNRFSMTVLLSLFILTGFSAVSLAESRGISIKIRAHNDPNAPVSEDVQLYDNSYALVIGIDDYSAGWPKLSKAVSDANEIADELKKKGFDVTLKTNLGSAELQQSLKEFFALKGADPKARLFLWYAGHGHTIKDEGFIVPTDAPPPTSPQFKLKAIHMRDFGGFMRLAESKHVFAVFDSCFSGTIFQTRAGMVPAAVTRATTKPVRQFLTSGDANQEVSDDGTFRKLFLRALRGESRADANGDGYLLGTELGLYLSGEVTNITEQTQTPRYGKLRDADYNLGDFVFVLPGRETQEAASGKGDNDLSTGTDAPKAPTTEDQMVEISLWASIAADNDITEFEKYLERYPDGHFSAVAKRKIEALKAAEAAPDPSSSEKAVEGKEKTEEASMAIASGSKLVETGEKQKQMEWNPTAPSQTEKSIVLKAATELDSTFAGTGKPALLKKEGEKGPKAAGMKDGYAIAPGAWSFSDPQGDSLYKVDGKWIHMRVNGGHNIWDCNRDRAPILSVQTPSSAAWTAQVKFELPARVGKTQVGLVLWNDRKERPVYDLVFGPVETDRIEVAGSYRDDCRSGPNNFKERDESVGKFHLHYTKSNGWLRLCKQADRVTFYFKSPHQKQWLLVGSVLTERKDGFSRVGLITKTWGNEPVQVSFSDFRIMPGLVGVKRWVPAYFLELEKDGEKTFSGNDFNDFEWSDPQGDSVHEIVGTRALIKANGGHNMWDCNRGHAPILSVETPPADTWSAQVEFDMPSRIGRSQIGMILWNGKEERPVYALCFGPVETGEIQVAGSYRDGCRNGPGDLRKHEGNTGHFRMKYDRTRGRLRISRDRNHFSFYFKSPHEKQWRKSGTVLASIKDGFKRIGLFVKTWGNQPVQVNFSNFTIVTGVAGVQRWIPAYFSRLKNGRPELFSGKDFSDFEWSDPQGDSVHQITGTTVRMKVKGGHNIWDCKRDLAPMLTVEAPPRDTWVAQVDFKLPSRVPRSQVGMVLWNGKEERPVYALISGPIETGGIQVDGSYRDHCRSGPGDLSKHPGNSGAFTIKNNSTEGRLRIIKTGNMYRFAFKPQKGKTWQDLGNLESTVKDGFKRVGMIAKTWGNKPVEVVFRNFTILPGSWN